MFTLWPVCILRFIHYIFISDFNVWENSAHKQIIISNLHTCSLCPVTILIQCHSSEGITLVVVQYMWCLKGPGGRKWYNVYRVIQINYQLTACNGYCEGVTCNCSIAIMIYPSAFISCIRFQFFNFYCSFSIYKENILLS